MRTSLAIIACIAALSGSHALLTSEQYDGVEAAGRRVLTVPTMSARTEEKPEDSAQYKAVADLQLGGSFTGGVPAEAKQQTSVPLREGLTIVTAIADEHGDYETIKRVQTITEDTVTIAYSGQVPGDSRTRTVRTIEMEDIVGATAYRQFFGNGQEHFPGSTAIGTSVAVLEALKTTGRTAFAWQSQTEPRTMLEGTLATVGTRTVPIPVQVNGEHVELPAIHARGSVGNGEEEGEFFFLDDPENPLSLQWTIGDTHLRVVNITFPSDRDRTIETALAEFDSIDIYDIYFDFGSAIIRPESETVLREIADVLRRNPEWALRVQGHTDSVGGAASNLELSKRRAAAVKDALVQQYGIADDRLTTEGFGASRPKDSNATLEGRARNRRVGLVRER